MRDYKIDVDNTIKYGILKENEICQYWNEDLRDIVSKYYNFCRESLDKYSEKVNIKPNIFVYNETTSSNAKAGRKLKTGENNENVFGITINKGLIVNCKEIFLDNEKLNVDIGEKYKNAVNNLDMKVSELAFQVAIQFTFYHELAHLLQYTKNNKEFELNENLSENSEYSIERHILEINADIFAFVNIAVNIIEKYREKNIKQNEDIDESIIIKDILIVVGICLLRHIISFYAEDTSMYINEKSHPHPFLRMLNALTGYSKYIEEIKIDDERLVDMKEIFMLVIDFYESKISQDIFGIDFSQFINGGRDKQEEIVNYLSKLNDFNLDDYNNAIDIWEDKILPELN